MKSLHVLYVFVLFACAACQDASDFRVNRLYQEYKLTHSGAAEAMDAWSFERTYPNEGIATSQLSKAFEQAKTDFASPRSAADGWENMGPENIGGRMLSMAFHPLDSNIIFAGSAGGGLWKTTTMGRGRYAWEHVPTGFPVIAVGDIAIDQNNPDIMYLGTGETYHNFGVAEPGIVNRFTRGTYGIGVLKSTDGGDTWSQVLAFDEPDLIGVADLEISPLNSNEIYAATNIGLYQSLNGGDSWDLILAVAPVIDLEIDPVDDAVLYVSTGNLNTNLNPALVGLYKSTNRGGNFTELLDDGLLPAWSGNAKLSISPLDHNVIYASIQVGWFNTAATTPAGIYRSDNAGINWQKIDSTNVAFWQGWYSHDIALHPSRAHEFIYVGLDAWKMTQDTLIKKSDWQKSTFGKVSVDSAEGPPDYVHADIHAVYYHPFIENKIFLATDGGIFTSNDAGETFVTISGGLRTTQFYPNFANSVRDSNFSIGGTQDNSSYIFDGTDSWSRIIGGDGMSASINPLDDNIIYGSAQGLFIVRSDNRGDSFKIISPPIAQNEITAFAGPYELAPSAPNMVYAGRQFLYRSDDHGDNWQPTGNLPVDGANVIINIAVSPLDPNKVMVTTSPNPFGGQPRPKILISENGGFNWTDISTSLPQRIVKDVAFDYYDDDIIYAVFSGFGSEHFGKSTDGGDSWVLNSDLPDVPTNTLVIDPLNTDHIYVGNDLGVYLSTDGGDSWENFSENMTDAVMIAHLSISPSNRKIRAASHGRGIFQRDLVYEISSSIAAQESQSGISVFPNPVRDEFNIQLDEEISGSVTISVVQMNGHTVKNFGLLHKDDVTNSFDMTDVAPGNYALIIDASERRTVIPLVKM